MRFKLVLLVKSESYGNTLPVSYQYELSAMIYRRIQENYRYYQEWLSSNGFHVEDEFRIRLLSYSNLYIPRIRVEFDRLHILVKRVQLWISFLPIRGTRELVNRLFAGISFVLGDRRSRVEFEVEEIVESPMTDFREETDYLSLSPIVFTIPRPNHSVEYIGPHYPGYADLFKHALLDKYKKIFGQPYEGDLGFEWKMLSPPKRKGIFMMRFTREESKVIGYMYKFRLKVNPLFHQLMYETGIGERIHQGFGCVEILQKEIAKKG